ncbi:MAG: nicotinate-nucleotide adenylyltransferase [Proteobacteria bacterium]|nr:nicotinate-nucleotide adenylyltransferase [Pseudomonadota bacterium]
MTLPRRIAAFRTTRCRIGLLGGSFNPAHDGHRHLSMEAIRHLKLDGVWWLVSPQNPLKPAAGMAPLAQRLAGARAIARHPKLMVTDLETRLGTVYTADTLRRLTRMFPHARFVWLMGADNLVQISRWERWHDIFEAAPVAVFARPTYCLQALASVAAHRFDRFRVPERSAGRLFGRNPPRWVFLHTRLHPASATRIRAAAALGHTTGERT